MSVPEWSGADVVYSKAYRILDLMAKRGGVTRNYQRGGYRCYPNEDMVTLIDALNDGNEERIKGLLLMTHVYSDQKTTKG